jgi:hypothetical protein
MALSWGEATLSFATRLIARSSDRETHQENQHNITQ